MAEKLEVSPPAEDILPPGRKVVLILVGLVASGKSTFAQALERYFPQFRRCNQDELGDRRSVEALARQSLREGLSVVIDRTNFDESQRATWIRIAGEVPRTFVWVIVFDTPYEVCAVRLRNRTDHPTITTPELGLEVLERFQSLFRPPLPHEGYSRILYLKPADLPQAPELSAQEVQGILRRLKATPEVVQTHPPMHDSAYGGYGWRGGYSRGYRGGRDYRGGYQPHRGFPPRGAPAYRADGAPRGGYRDGPYRDEGALHWNTRRATDSFNVPEGGGSSSGWDGHPPATRGCRSGRGVSDYDRTERDWRR
ncbi:AAA domain-containing protein [Ganoderma leucocontextum]|nr:AAA domain-containing protein [Ganoderma leucocontextum]